MNDFRRLTTKEKALKINLDPQIYGSFAEIGAGQEVASNFFRAGGASGTIAKTISAYDMTFSDSIYGKCERYVCEPRLMNMLDKEYSLLEARLQERASYTRFFAFANTVEAVNYSKSNQGQGWIGLRFQLHPESEPNDVILHVLMHDNDNLSQHQALGVLGVNLIYACFFDYKDPEYLMNSLVNDLTPGRVEIDMIRFSGPDFTDVDDRLMALKLVKNGLSKAAMFGPDGLVIQPHTALYKKNILILRSRFRPVTHVTMDMLQVGRKQYAEEEGVREEKIVVLAELSLNNLRTRGRIDDKDFLDRVDVMCSLGKTVMISNFEEYYKLVDYLSPLAKGRRMGFVLGIHNLINIFDEKYYQDLRGGILQAFGQLFAKNLRFYVYPELDPDSGEKLTCSNFQVEGNLQSLYQYLLESDKVVDLTGAREDILHIISDNVLKMIKDGEMDWKGMVPDEVSAKIIEKHLFGYLPQKGLNGHSTSEVEEKAVN